MFNKVCKESKPLQTFLLSLFIACKQQAQV